MHSLLLNLFTFIALFSAIMVIASKNPIHSVVFLILVFVNAAGLLVLLKIDFIAMMFLIIYVGAIAVLFLFVVMMLNIKLNELNENWVRYLPIGGIISLIFLLEIFLILDSGENMFSEYSLSTSWKNVIIDENITIMNNVTLKYFISLYENFFMVRETWPALIDSLTNIQSLGFLIYTYYFYYFIIASIILLVAMIGAIVLTMHKRKFSSKKQLIYKQIARTFSNAISYTR